MILSIERTKSHKTIFFFFLKNKSKNTKKPRHTKPTIISGAHHHLTKTQQNPNASEQQIFKHNPQAILRHQKDNRSTSK